MSSINEMRLGEKVNTINLKNIFCSYNVLICLSSVYSKKKKNLNTCDLNLGLNTTRYAFLLVIRPETLAEQKCTKH